MAAAIAEPVCERLAAKTGLKREQILLSSSHIHTGPAVTLDLKERESKTTMDDQQRTVEYTRQRAEAIRGQNPSPPEPVYAIGSLEWQRQQEQARGQR